jgi:CRP-like cAMP-binding protein
MKAVAGQLYGATMRAHHSCGETDLAAVDMRAILLDVRREATLAQGRRQREVLVLVDRTAEVLRDGQRLAELGPGDLVGDLEALTLSPARSTVRTTPDARALVVSDIEFRSLLDASPRKLA